METLPFKIALAVNLRNLANEKMLLLLTSVMLRAYKNHGRIIEIKFRSMN
jgi:hypothetical protein